MKKMLIAVETVLIVLIGGFLLLIYSGWYNIAATVGHYGVIRWVLETTMENSVRYHAKGIAVPPLDNLDLQQGFRHFHRMCVMCHGAPGVERSEIGKGILPEPPDLAKVVPEWLPEELFWIVQNGIKMSGMPAFGPTHNDQDIWNVVAFVRQLPRLTPADYQALEESLRQGAPDQHPPNGHPPAPGGKPAGGLPPRLRLPENAEIETVLAAPVLPSLHDRVADVH